MRKIVFTNGCFDLLHPGHVDLLERARALGDRLIVGINGDASVREIKGGLRPICNEEQRKAVLLGLKAVDEVRIFTETTPENLIREIAPDVLVKGGDWRTEEIIGADFVLRNGGRVYSLPLKEGFSTTRIIEKIQAAGGALKDKLNGKDCESMNDRHSAIEMHLKSFGETMANLTEICLPQVEKSAALITEVRRTRKNIFLIRHNEAQKYEAFGEFRELEKSSIDFWGEGELLLAFGGGNGGAEITETLIKARRAGWQTIAVCGLDDKKMAALSDISVIIPSNLAWEIQAAQQLLLRIWQGLSDESPEINGNL